MRLWAAILLTLAAGAPRVLPAQETPIEQAVALVQGGRLEEAIAVLEPLRTQPAPSSQALAMLGGLYAETGRHGQALEVLEPLARSKDADPAVLYNAGQAALALDRIEEAEGYLERSVERAPGSPASRSLGLLRGRQGRYEEAFILLRPWVRKNPDDTEARLAAALAALRLERAPEVEEQLSDLPQTDPRVRLLWGRLLILKGDPRGAIATLKPLIESAPPEMDLDIRRTLAEAYNTVGESASAVELLSGHIQGQPAAALDLARAQQRSGDAAEALATIRPAAQRLLTANDPVAAGLEAGLAARIVLLYGRLLVSDGRAEQAIPALELATRLASDDKEAWQGLGQALAASGRAEDAKEALARFQELAERETRTSVLEREESLRDPTGWQVRKGFELLAQGRMDQALEVARRETRLAPEDPRPLLLAGSTLLHLDRPDEAVAQAEQAAALEPDDPDVIYLRGTTRMAIRDLEGAEADLRRTLELVPDHVAAINDLAVLLIEKGERQEARRLLERALELRPDDPVARGNLERLDEP